MKTDVILENYKNHLEEKKLNEKTIIVYLRNLDNFLNFLKTENKTYQNITSINCLNYISSLSELGYSKSKLNLIICSLKSFYNYLVKYENHNYNYFKDIKQFKLDKKMPFIYDLKSLLKKIKSISNIEHRLIVMLLLTTGISVKELINIKIKDIDMEDTSIIITGKKTRKVYFDYLTNDNLINYLVLNPNNTYLFEKANSEKITISRINSIISNMDIFENSIQTNASNLRTVFATEMINNGMDLVTLKILLGVETIETVKKYQNSNFQYLIDVMNTKHPIKKYIKKIK